MLVDLAAALVALDLDAADPADTADVEVLMAILDRRYAERPLREVGHPSVTGPRIRPVTSDPRTPGVAGAPTHDPERHRRQLRRHPERASMTVQVTEGVGSYGS